jgi:hypothetical protein
MHPTSAVCNPALQDSSVCSSSIGSPVSKPKPAIRHPPADLQPAILYVLVALTCSAWRSRTWFRLARQVCACGVVLRGLYSELDDGQYDQAAMADHQQIAHGSHIEVILQRISMRYEDNDVTVT